MHVTDHDTDPFSMCLYTIPGQRSRNISPKSENRTVLDSLHSIATAPKASGGYDVPGKSAHEIFKAVTVGHLEYDEGLIALQNLLMNTDDSETGLILLHR